MSLLRSFFLSYIELRLAYPEIQKKRKSRRVRLSLLLFATHTAFRPKRASLVVKPDGVQNVAESCAEAAVIALRRDRYHVEQVAVAKQRRIDGAYLVAP